MIKVQGTFGNPNELQRKSSSQQFHLSVPLETNHDEIGFYEGSGSSAIFVS